ncbi:putative membrane protein YqjE [Streptomyces paradoxus]|uniref:Putative membrane protein YqjE n=1 Tax=Streptomyces paradoxus TaxID=66375 RepID=A0A7W9TJD0_9ACTN|nr:DUF6328 family protein [Streptomyces paradoxus]MBB6081181.1 putative membrane protein YqjE [Streptomyces paradoxus]
MFDHLADTERALYVSAVCTGAACVGAFLGPVASHRLVTSRGIKPQTVTLAARLFKAGLALLMVTISLTLLLLMRLAFDDTLGLWLTAAIVVCLSLVWVVPPLWARRHYTTKHQTPRTRQA